MVVVTAAIISKGSKLLIARRASVKHLGGFWEFPGGKIEPGETAEECLTREIKEELNITIKIKSFFMESAHQYNDKKILLKVFLCEYISGIINLKDHDQYEWVQMAELNKRNLAPADIPIANSLMRLNSKMDSK